MFSCSSVARRVCLIVWVSAGVVVVRLVAIGLALDGWFAAVCERLLPAFYNYTHINFVWQCSKNTQVLLISSWYLF